MRAAGAEAGFRGLPVAAALEAGAGAERALMPGSAARGSSCLLAVLLRLSRDMGRLPVDPSSCCSTRSSASLRNCKHVNQLYENSQDMVHPCHASQSQQLGVDFSNRDTHLCCCYQTASGHTCAFQLRHWRQCAWMMRAATSLVTSISSRASPWSATTAAVPVPAALVLMLLMLCLTSAALCSMARSIAVSNHQPTAERSSSSGCC